MFNNVIIVRKNKREGRIKKVLYEEELKKLQEDLAAEIKKFEFVELMFNARNIEIRRFHEEKKNEEMKRETELL